MNHNPIDLTNPFLQAEFMKLGLNPEALESLPERVKNDLASGNVTELILVSVSFESGRRLEMPLKLQLSQNPLSGSVSLLAYPVYRQPVNYRLIPDNDFAALAKGNILEYTSTNGIRSFSQMDNQTKFIYTLDGKQIDEKLADFEKVNDIQLGLEQKRRVREGKPITLQIGEENVTVGLDLKSPMAFRLLQGDLREWERQKAIEYDLAHPEYIGLVQTEANRWEYLMVVKEGLGCQSLKEAPRQVKSAGMRL